MGYVQWASLCVCLILVIYICVIIDILCLNDTYYLKFTLYTMGIKLKSYCMLSTLFKACCVYFRDDATMVLNR